MHPLIPIDRLSVSRYWAIALLALLAASYQLWMPPDSCSTPTLPAVAAIDISDRFGAVLAYLVPIAIVTGCWIVIIWDSAVDNALARTGWFLAGFGIAVSFLLDELRLQPWAYQCVLYAMLWVILPGVRARVFLKMVTIGIYAYSAIGKFDFQFVHTVGQEFLSTAVGFVGIDAADWSATARHRIVMLFPIAELTASLLLAVSLFQRSGTRRSRCARIGGGMAIAMHASLILLLSRWGMNHSPGVLVWNAALAGQAYLLFVREPSSPPVHDASSSPNSSTPNWCRSVAIGLVALTMTLPLTERRDRADDKSWHWDHWLSWALYSPHNSRFHFEIHRSLVSKLPVQYRSSVREDTNEDGWQELDLGALSLAIRGVPVVPQARVQLGLAIAIAEEQGWGEDSAMRGILRSSSDRFNGRRRETWLNGITEMRRAADSFVFLKNQ